MKRFAVLTAAAITAVSAISGAASAQGYATGDVARAELSRVAPTADVSALTNAEAVAVWHAVQDETSAFNAKQRAETMIRSYQ